MILIHGDDSTKSRDYLNSLREDYERQNFQVTTISGSKLNKVDLENLGVGQSLFEEKKLVIVEGFFSEKKNKDLIWPDALETIFYEEAKLATIPKNYKLEIKLFEFETIVFKFLDSLAPHGQKAFMPLFEKYIHATVPELVFTMIVRQFRFMLLSLEESVENPDDYLRLALWQTGKIKAQADKFGYASLVGIYGNLLSIDEETKTGKSELPLESRLELLLLTI